MSADRARALAPPLALLLLLASPVRDAPAQAPGPDEPALPPAGDAADLPRTVAAGFTGILAPLSRLTAGDGNFETEVSVAPAFGVEVVRWLDLPFGVSVQGMYAPARLSLIPADVPGALPDGLGDADYWAGSANLLYRLPGPVAGSAIRPYVAAGAGLRRLDVDPQAAPEVRDATDPLLTVAAGAFVRFGSRTLVRFEFRDHATRYAAPAGSGDRLQNDLGVTVGLAVGVP